MFPLLTLHSTWYLLKVVNWICSAQKVVTRNLYTIDRNTLFSLTVALLSSMSYMPLLFPFHTYTLLQDKGKQNPESPAFLISKEAAVPGPACRIFFLVGQSWRLQLVFKEPTITDFQFSVCEQLFQILSGNISSSLYFPCLWLITGLWCTNVLILHHAIFYNSSSRKALSAAVTSKENDSFQTESRTALEEKKHRYRQTPKQLILGIDSHCSGAKSLSPAPPFSSGFNPASQCKAHLLMC